MALAKTTADPRLSELNLGRSWPRTPAISSAFRITPEGLLASMTNGEETRQILLNWAFGAGSQGITFVGKLPSQLYLEFSLSYYNRKREFGITPGHESLHPAALAQALGHPYEIYSQSGEILECFQCHSTGPVGVTPDDRIEPSEIGVRCEACHGAGAGHRDAALRGLPERARASIRNPGKLSSTQLNVLCGTCHRFQAQGRAPLNLTFPWNVRHQPPFLERSACFRKSSGKLSCLTCHDPHRSAVYSNADFYNKKCLACHGDPPRHTQLESRDGCIGCHMPAVRPSEYMEFRSHWIGIYPSAQESGVATRFLPPKA